MFILYFILFFESLCVCAVIALANISGYHYHSLHNNHNLELDSVLFDYILIDFRTCEHSWRFRAVFFCHKVADVSSGVTWRKQTLHIK